MAESKPVVKVGKIQQRILLIRGEKVIVDADLAEFYGVPTKALNQAVRRNTDRFPADFMFQGIRCFTPYDLRAQRAGPGNCTTRTKVG